MIKVLANRTLQCPSKHVCYFIYNEDLKCLHNHLCEEQLHLCPESLYVSDYHFYRGILTIGKKAILFVLL